MCASIHRGRDVQAQFFIYVSSSPSPPLPRSKASIIQASGRHLGTGHLREQEPFYREQVLLCDIFTSLYE